MVFVGLVLAWRRATCPTNRSPVFEKATTEGVVRNPSAFGMTLGSPPSITATHEFVVPRSIPIIFAIVALSRTGGRTACAARPARVHWVPSRSDLDFDLPQLGLVGLGDAHLQH